MRYIKGEIFRYFEFYKQEYYALIKVNEMNSVDAYNKSVRLYVEHVGGENVAEVKLEGTPRELTEDEALLKFIKADGNKEEKAGYLISQFKIADDVTLLVDGLLL
ncbi:hypothetical protein JNUCC1_03336 [Lentibacillus sp. JNUCC-1]|uniref:hypothetical protein n=1 Tax=Lentibacillus sp. JNUCC-1 TaxID=2654513 RepID=UPI0012E9045F|nr:hypothetical protein [Lentibacillus sp. JNUCC-1]MUV39458.1 hypothetical protein [Lentibacillus sp. JNUCC-1]